MSCKKIVIKLCIMFICFSFNSGLASGKSPSIDSDWWMSFQKNLATYEYHPVEYQNKLQAINRAHQFKTFFEPSGIRVQDRIATSDSTLVTLHLSGIGHGHNVKPVSKGTVNQVDQKIEISRPGITEWYKNTTDGLEQGFNLSTAIEGEGPLILELAIAFAEARLVSNSVELKTVSGRLLDYGKLVAIDATGAVLVSHMEVPAPDRIRLVVDDANAVYPLVVDPLLTGVRDALLESNQADPQGIQPAAFGAWVSSAGDVNGDGFDDVIVGAPGYESILIHEGAAFVFLGSVNGIQGSDPATAHAQINSTQSGAELGSSVSSAGDVNGDGFDDILVGAHFYDSTIPAGRVSGAVFLFLGSAEGITAIDETMADAWIQSDGISSNLGTAMSSAGDVNGDGFDDIILGAPSYGVPFLEPTIPANDLQGSAGIAVVYLGGPQGIVSDGTPGFSAADTIIRPFAPGDRSLSGGVGATVSGAGDVNGDGFSDILIGAPTLEGTNLGGVMVYLGGPSGITGTDPNNAHAIIRSDSSNPILGKAIAGGGDFNADGFSDIVLGVPDATGDDPFIVLEGAVIVFLADSAGAGITATGPADATNRFLGSVTAEKLGARVAVLGDVDADGFDDIAALAINYPGNLDSEGIYHIFRGSPGGIIGTSLRDAYTRFGSGQLSAVRLGNRLAIGLGLAGDVNADGFADAITGYGYFDNGEENEGAAGIYLGGPAPAINNIAPVAIPGPNQLLYDIDNNSVETATLDGNQSFDPDGNIVSYQWFDAAGNLLGSSAVLTTELGIGFHVLSLSVKDDGGKVTGTPVQVKVDIFQMPMVGFDNFDIGFPSGGIRDWLGPWTTIGNVSLINSGGSAFSTPLNVNIGQSPGSLERSVSLPAGTTGVVVGFWKRPGNFAPGDTVEIQLSRDGGAFTTVETVTAAESDGSFQFRNNSLDWFPQTASSLTIRIVSQLTTGNMFIDDVLVRALVAPPSSTQLPPVANAEPDQTVSDTSGDGRETVSLNGTSSADPDGNIVLYEWFEVNTLLGVGPIINYPFVGGIHVVTLEVTDNVGSVRGDNMIVTVSTDGGVGNQPPIADAGGNQTIIDTDDNGTEDVSLNAAASVDPDGNIASYVWREGATQLATGINPTISLAIGSHQINLMVTDNNGATATTSVTIIVETGVTSGPIASDGFETANFSGGTGNWVGNWLTAGNVRMRTNRNNPHSGDNHVRLRRTNAVLERTVDTNGSSQLHLRYWGKANRLLGADHVIVSVSADSGTFITVENITTADSDNSYHLHEIDLSGFAITADVRIRFDSNMDNGLFFIDDVEITGATGPAPTPDPVINSFTATPAVITTGSSTQLAWNTLNASSVTIDNGVGAIAAVGSVNVTPVETTTYTLTATAANGSVSSSVVVAVNAPTNQTPIANAGPNQSAADGDGNGQQLFTLDASNSSDPDGTIVSYAWSESGLVIGNTSILNVNLGTGSHTITLLITDNQGATASDTTLITLTPNQPPSVFGGADQVVTDSDLSGNETVALSESGSFDADGNIAAFEWREGASLLGTGPSIAVPMTIGTHTITLTGTDNGGALSSDSVVITVTQNLAPVANAGPDQIVVDTDGNTLEVITFDGTASSDPEGGTLTYFWTKNGIPFGNTATFSLTQPIGVHTVVLTVTDNLGRTSTDTVVVTIEAAVAPPGNIPPTANAGTNQTVTANAQTGLASILLDGTASFDPDGTIAGYEWREGANLLGSSAVQGVPLGVGVHTITLTVSDNVFATGSDTVVITVNPATINQSPLANAGVDQTVTDSDGNGSETVQLNGSGSTDADGTISSYQWSEDSAILGTGSTLNATFISGVMYEVLLTVVDNEGATGTDTMFVTVNNVSTPPQAVVSMSGPASIERGDNISISVTLTNTGSSTLSGVQLNFNVSPNRLLKNLNPGGSASVGNVAEGASVTQTWTARGDNEGLGTVSVIATSNGTNLDSASQSLTVIK
jgi:hypothetical protein